MRVYYDRGERVPDTEIMPLVLPHVRRIHGWILDNFPATAAQAQALDAELEELGLSRVISLEGPTDEELVERVLSGRVRGFTTGLVYHLVHDPPRGHRRGRIQARSSVARTTPRRLSGDT